MRIAQLGTFDVENYGDLLFPLILKRRLPSPEFESIAVSPVGHASPCEDCSPSISFEDLARSIDDIDGIIVGGGNIIHVFPSALSHYDRGGISPLVAYANLWMGAALLAARRRIPLSWNCPGVPGPLGGVIAEAVEWTLSQVDYASVRDAASRSFLTPAAPSKTIHVVPDSALEVSRLWTAEELRTAFEDAFRARGMQPPPATVAFHFNERYTDEAPEGIAARIRRICERQSAMPILLALGPCHGDDHLQRRIAGALGVEALLVDRPRSLREAAACIAGSQAYMGSSLHGVITACSFGVRALAVAPAHVPKLGGFLEQFELGSWQVESWKQAEELAEQFFAVPGDIWGRVLERATPLFDRHWAQIMDCLRSKPAGESNGRRPLEELTRLVACAGSAGELLQPILAHSALNCFRNQESIRKKQALLKRELEAARGRKQAPPPGGGSAAGAGGSFPLLQKRLSRQEDDIRQLAGWIEKLGEHFKALLGSRQLKLASAASRVYRKLLRKPPAPSFRRRIDAVLERYSAWTKMRTREPSRKIEAAAAPARRRRADIVLTVHNAAGDLRRCLESLERNTNLIDHRLILVDDASDAEAAGLVVDAASRLGGIYIRNEERKGYTRAANQGLEASSGDYVVLLNSDTLVTPGWIEKLTACADSTARVGAVGPLSNAASWQSIPEQTDALGKWRVNSLPEGTDLESYSLAIGRQSPRLYPRVPLLNGFCYLITREALAAVGSFDEESFPEGYGEEDDMSIRLADAGFHLLVADDCYIYHAKSKSFTPELRAVIVERSKGTLAVKHGHERVRGLVESIRQNEALLRSRVAADLSGRQCVAEVARRSCADWGLTVGWLMPHLGTVGGVRRTIEMTNRLVAWGLRTVLLTPDGKRTEWLPIAAEVAPFHEMSRYRFDILLATDPDVIRPFTRQEARLKILYHLGAYRLHREATRELEEYYSIGNKAAHLANSRWTAEQIEAECDVERILPGGVSPSLFHPVDTEVTHDVACYGSYRVIKGTRLIEAAASEHRLLRLEDMGARQQDLARYICSARLFASACAAEGFNFCPLEAMACGVPVVMTDDGGSREYARNGQNAVVIERRDVESLKQGIGRVLEDRALRLKLIEGGLRTAHEYTWDGVSAGLVDFIGEKLRALPAGSSDARDLRL
jgi:GT2 family glycosyltransferase/polysaccharide pyruvyl transferase WcaK-like protein